MTPPGTHRGLVAGLGAMGSNHLRVLSSMDEVEVVGVVEPDAARRERAGVPGFATLSEALSATDADFACLAVPVDELPVLATEAIEAGVAVLAEKPMAPDEDSARAMIELAEAREVLLGVGLVERCNPAVRALRERIDSIGRIYQLHARRLSPFPNRDSMLGVAVDLATHDIDVMRFVLGEEVERVYAETAQRRHERAEDLLCSTLRFTGGQTGLLEVNWLTPTKVRQLAVTGEGGMFVVDYLTQDLTFWESPRSSNDWAPLVGMRGGGEGDMTRYALDRREPLRVEWEEFLAALGSGSPAPCGGREGLAALSTALAIQRSGERHEVVEPAS